MKKIAYTAVLSVLLVVLGATAAWANHVESFEITCEGWSVSFALFHTAHDHNIMVHVDGTDYPVPDFEGSTTASGALPEGAADDGEVSISSDWTHDGEPRSFGPETVAVDCATPTPTPTPTTTPGPHTNCHETGTCHTRHEHTPNVNEHTPRQTAFTGSETVPLALLALGLVIAGLYLLRRSARDVS